MNARHIDDTKYIPFEEMFPIHATILGYGLVEV